MPDRPSKLITTWLLVVAAALSSTVLAQDPARSPCTEDSGPARDFDFWVGQWQVVQPDSGDPAGNNRISVREGGCLLVEDWQGASGSTGMSINFQDPQRGAWRQIWQSAGALIELEGGLDDDGRMAMDGTIFYHARGEQFPFRGRWTPRDDGTVLQEFWQQGEGGEWSSWFVGEYQPID